MIEMKTIPAYEISTEEENVTELLTQKYRAYISDTPPLLSLLYDIDLLPEQIRLHVNAVRMAAVCELYKLAYDQETIPPQR